MTISDYYADFLTDFGEFAEFDQSVVEQVLGNTSLEIGSAWGSYESTGLGNSIHRQGWFNLAAHTVFIRLAQIQSAEEGFAEGSTRGTDSVNVGDTSLVSGTQMFLKLTPENDALATTAYGVEYMKLRRRLGGGIWVI